MANSFEQQIYVGLDSSLLPIDQAICAFMVPEEVYVHLVQLLPAGRYLVHVAEQPEQLEQGFWRELLLSKEQVQTLLPYDKNMASYQIKQALQCACPALSGIQAAPSSPAKDMNLISAPRTQLDIDQVDYRAECVILPLEHIECARTPDQPPRSQATIDRLLLRNCLHYLRDSRKCETKKPVRRALKRLEYRIRRVFWLHDFHSILHKLLEITPIFGRGAHSTQLVAFRIDIDVPIAA